MIFHLIFDIPTFMQYSWGLDGSSDLSMHLTGYYAFRASPWNFPLLWTDHLWAPEGISVFFTDSIPLFALPFKLLAPLLAPNFHYFKIWLLLCYLLQPVSAVYLVRKLGQRGIWAALLAAAFSLLLKWFLFRFNHAALNAQFVLIFSLALYVEQRRIFHGGSNTGSLALRWTVLVLAAFLIQSYMFAMVFGIFAASVLDGKYDLPTHLSRWLHRFNLFLWPVLALACAYFLLIGRIETGDVPRAEGFGYFSLNLTGVINGGNLIHLPQTLNLNPGQLYEDQSYLGLGVIGIILSALWLDRKNLVKRVLRSPALMLVLLGLYVFALSSDVYLGATRVYHYPDWLAEPLFASPLSQFRASARFFWPVGYALLFWGLAVILRRRWAVPVLAALLILQWVDLPRPFTPRPAGYTQAFNPDAPAWDRLFQDKRALYLYPTYYCGGDADFIGLPIVHLAAKDGLISNTTSVSRLTENCPNKVTQGLADWAPGTVHVFTRPDEYSTLFLANPDWCAERIEMAVCVPYANTEDRAFLAALDTLTVPAISHIFDP